MLDYHDLVNGSFKIKKNEDIDIYLNDFFVKGNYKQYRIDDDCIGDNKKAIKVMFDEKKELSKRIDDAFSYNPFCIEAFFAYMLRSDDVFLSYRFTSYYETNDSYADLESYEKRCYITIMKFYVSFLMDVNNITTAIKVQKMIIRLCNDDDYENIKTLATLYYLIEDEKELYKLYCQSEFEEYEYLLTIITELKYEEDLKARQILFEMFDKFEYAKYLDHVWDLDLTDPKQKHFYDIVDKCFDNTLSIPNFFSWVNMQKEKNEE